jgi:hypothetical protein
MQVFQTKRQIHKYVKEQTKKLKKFGYYHYGKIEYDFYGGVAIFRKGWGPEAERYASVLLYSEHVGKGIVREVQKYRKLKIITLRSCGIADYLDKKEIPHMVLEDEC